MEETNNLRQQILQEESKRIRAELLKDLEEQKDKELRERLEKELEKLREGFESDKVVELEETIEILRNNFEKSLLDMKRNYAREALDQSRKDWEEKQKFERDAIIKEEVAKVSNKFTKEKEAELMENEKKWKQEIENQRLNYEHTLSEELEKAKSSWKLELDSLQKQHEEVIEKKVEQLNNKFNREKQERKGKVTDYVSKLKKEFVIRMEKQKREQENYYNELTKKTVEIARKDWMSELEKKVKEAYQRGLQQSGNKSRDINNNECDSGFMSPFGRNLETSETTVDNIQRKGVGSQPSVESKREKNHSPQYEEVLLNYEEEISRLRREKETIEERRKLTNSFTQTDIALPANAECLEDMRQYYLDAVVKIKEDVLKHVSKTRESAAKSIRNEVAKEKNDIISKIRKHYLKKPSSKAKQDTKIAKEDVVTARGKPLANGLTEREVEQNESKCHLERDPSQILPERLHSRMHDHQDKALTNNSVLSQVDSQREKAGRQSTKLSSRNKKPDRVRTKSPTLSMFSFESDATLYTELPSSVGTTILSNSGHLARQDGTLIDSKRQYRYDKDKLVYDSDLRRVEPRVSESFDGMSRPAKSGGVESSVDLSKYSNGFLEGNPTQRLHTVERGPVRVTTTKEDVVAEHPTSDPPSKRQRNSYQFSPLPPKLPFS